MILAFSSDYKIVWCLTKGGGHPDTLPLKEMAEPEW